MTYTKQKQTHTEESHKISFPWIPVIAFLTGFAGMRIGLDIFRYKRQQNQSKNLKTKKEEEDVS